MLICLRRSLSLLPGHTSVAIESANFAYAMFAFCNRQMRVFRRASPVAVAGGGGGVNPGDVADPELCKELADLSPMYIKSAGVNYDKVGTIVDHMIFT